MAMMSADLRGACPLTQEFAFLGMRRTLGDTDADNLDFATHHYTPHRPREGDFCEVSYFLEKDRGTGQFTLWRRRNPVIAIEPLNGGRREEIIRGVLGMRFEYHDGWEWYDQWGDADQDKRRSTPKAKQDTFNQEGMPEAVRISLWLDANARGTASTNEPPLMFQTVARLNLTAAPQPPSSGASSTNAAPSAAEPSGAGSNSGGSN